MTVSTSTAEFLRAVADEFTEFPKMARLSRECIISEKIDGTNAQIYKLGNTLRAGSRTRWITPEDDNHGFAAWVRDHHDELMMLPDGRHFGEWWGQGIQRKYGLSEKRFSMFNVLRFHLHGTPARQEPTADPRVIRTSIELPPCVGLVPVLYRGPFSTHMVDAQIVRLMEHGSMAAPGFMKPEGVVCFHIAANVGFKKTLEKDEEPKSLHR